jgi:hypothetical protein
VQEKALAKVNDPNLKVYVVWTPILASDYEVTVKRATTWVLDERASHYWDRGGQLSADYSRLLQMGPGGKAWDIYFVYGREAEWKDGPPTAFSSMDQIGLGRELDAEALAVELKTLLESAR